MAAVVAAAAEAPTEAAGGGRSCNLLAEHTASHFRLFEDEDAAEEEPIEEPNMDHFRNSTGHAEETIMGLNSEGQCELFTVSDSVVSYRESVADVSKI